MRFSSQTINGHLGLRFFVAGMSVVLVACLTAPSSASNSPVVRVEEDWELVVATPDVNSVGPQVACAISPFGHVDSLYVTFELNHRSAPDSGGGGLHLQVWKGDYRVATRDFPDADAMETEGEVVRWTQTMSIQSGQVVFEVVNGHSVTWGNFGGEGNLKATVDSLLSNLNYYSPSVSTSNSGVTFASHCVHSLVLKTVRVYREDGTIATVSLNHAVYLEVPRD